MCTQYAYFRFTTRFTTSAGLSDNKNNDKKRSLLLGEYFQRNIRDSKSESERFEAFHDRFANDILIVLRRVYADKSHRELLNEDDDNDVEEETRRNVISEKKIRGIMRERDPL